MAENHVLLETIQLTQTAASVTFDNIPQTGYTDLKIVASSRIDSTTPNIEISFNGSTTSFSNKVVYGDGSTAASTSYARHIGYATMSSNTANTFGSAEIYIPNYTSSNHKSFSSEGVSENNATQAYSSLDAGLWSNTAAITSITLTPQSANNFVANSTFSLYGIAALGTTPTVAPKATGGNIVANDGTYWYHAFLTSGNFTPQIELTCDVLTIAGGGAGGRGGGGAGGLVYATAQSVTTLSQVTVGAGGATRTSDGAGLSNPGNNSQFASLTAAIGGGAAGGYSVNGGNGGSGGGAGWGAGAYSGGTGSQGSNGGAGDNAGGGGGGFSTAGASGASGTPTAGGNGSSTYSSWGLATNTGQNVSGTRWYAGGGGASGNTSQSNTSGGNGGGGTGVSSSGGTPVAGTANTGGGGGGGSGSTTIGGAAGGSGIVIIRYPMA